MIRNPKDMVMPIAQRCSKCGKAFLGNDCIVFPIVCPKCEAYNEHSTERDPDLPVKDASKPSQEGRTTPAPVEPATPITDRATWRGHCGDGDWGDVVYADLARQLEAHAQALETIALDMKYALYGHGLANPKIMNTFADWRAFCKEHGNGL